MNAVSGAVALPHEVCRAPPGEFVPLVDRAKCEGNADCVEVCPYQVFEVRRINSADFAQLSIVGKLRSIVHGRQSAYTPLATVCQACGKCAQACPEKAITLTRAPR